VEEQLRTLERLSREAIDALQAQVARFQAHDREKGRGREAERQGARNGEVMSFRSCCMLGTQLL
jgi:hypothetical protein